METKRAGYVELEWTTHFTSKNEVIHSFGNGYQIIADRNLDRAYKLKDGKIKESFSIEGMLLETWDQIVANFAKAINS